VYNCIDFDEYSKEQVINFTLELDGIFLEKEKE
jgi:hypothetical protein